MKKTGQGKNLISYNLRKSLLYLQRARQMAIQINDKECAYSIQISIAQVSDRLRKINEKS